MRAFLVMRNSTCVWPLVVVGFGFIDRACYLLPHYNSGSTACVVLLRNQLLTVDGDSRVVIAGPKQK